MDEALPLSFERSAEKGIDLNSALGNALAASIHAILQDAMVVTLEVDLLPLFLLIASCYFFASHALCRRRGFFIRMVAWMEALMEWGFLFQGMELTPTRQTAQL